MIRRRINHANTKCCICESPKSILKYIDYEGKPIYLWYREYDKNNDWTGRYMCNKCWNKESPNSFDNIQKSLRIKRTRLYKYNKTNTCDRCGEELRDRVQKEYDKEGYWTKKWLCHKCAAKEDNKERFLSNHKIGNLDPYSTTGKGYISQAITCKTRGVKDLNIENDNWLFPMDHTRDPELGIIQSKCALYNNGRWHNGSLINEYGKDFDYIIFYCFDSGMKIILRVYIIPKGALKYLSSITIYENGGWYDKYRVDEKQYNSTYHNLNKDDLKGIKDINLFLKSIIETK